MTMRMNFILCSCQIIRLHSYMYDWHIIHIQTIHTHRIQIEHWRVYMSSVWKLKTNTNRIKYTRVYRTTFSIFYLLHACLHGQIWHMRSFTLKNANLWVISMYNHVHTNNHSTETVSVIAFGFYLLEHWTLFKLTSTSFLFLNFYYIWPRGVLQVFASAHVVWKNQNPVKDSYHSWTFIWHSKFDFWYLKRELWMSFVAIFTRRGIQCFGNGNKFHLYDAILCGFRLVDCSLY